MASIPLEQLLAEIEDVLRTMPPFATIRHNTPDNVAWEGRAVALMHLWDPVRAVQFNGYMESAHAVLATVSVPAIRSMQRMLHAACQELRMQTMGPMTVVVGQGSVFNYFDEIRKIIETAKIDILFVDPYLDAEFVARYLPNVADGVSVRLLGKERMSTLIPAVDLLRRQNNMSIEVRIGTGFHDRYLFIDRSACYQSGASFKDGAKKSPTTVTQIVDAFDAMQATYDTLWNKSTLSK